MNELWIMVVGGDDDDERCICKGSIKEIEEAVYKSEDEVMYDPDKYFELSTSTRNYTFYSYRDFLRLNLM